MKDMCSERTECCVDGSAESSASAPRYPPITLLRIISRKWTICQRVTHLLQFLSQRLHSFFGRTARRRWPWDANSCPTGPPSRTQLPSSLATILVFSVLVACSEACSSRNTPKPRPPPPSARPNVTFPTYTCPPAYAAWYCLNGATCFTIKIEDSLLYNCECAEGYMGQRCEFKDLDGSYLPSRHRVLLETASIAGGATIAVFLVVIICVTLYLHWARGRAKQRLLSSATGAPRGGDCVDFSSSATDSDGRLVRPFAKSALNTPTPTIYHHHYYQHHRPVSLAIPMDRLDERHTELAVKAKSQLSGVKTVDSTAYRTPP